VRPRHIAPVALVLALTFSGFIVARTLAERDVRRDSEQRAEVAAAQVRGRIAQASSLTESLRRFMLDASGTGVSSDQFARNALRWLSPARFPAAAWVERVPDSRRAAYERLVRQPIVSFDDRHTVVPLGSRRSYLPATLVSGFPPLAVPGTDLSGVPGMASALTRATRLDRVSATPMAAQTTGRTGLFLVAPAPNLIGEVFRRGYVVVNLSDRTLRAAGTDADTVQIMPGGTSTDAGERARTASKSFAVAGQRFDVVVPRESVRGASAVMPWIILVGGLVVAALGAALGRNAARRSGAQDELDRIFTLSSDLITVANFKGYFTRVNPAAERVLGYPESELLGRPFLDFVHPDDRERTVAEADAIGRGMTTLSFENRFIRKDGSYRTLAWTATPLVEEGVMYGMARDVTERRRAEAELERLAGEQAALRRVATLVARGVAPLEVFSAVAEEVRRLLDAEATVIARLETDGTMAITASSGTARDETPVGSRLEVDSGTAIAIVLQTGHSARVDDFDNSSPLSAERAARLGFRCSVAVPITVEGALWGSIGAGTEREQFPADAEQRMAEFTELLATAIANADSRAQLAGSRRRIVAAADGARRRIERDLHDGIQQRLVALGFEVRAARSVVPTQLGELEAALSHIAQELGGVFDELLEITRGIHPAALAEGGLRPALTALCRRSAVTVALDLHTERRLPEPVEVAAYYVVSEALTNVAKHAQASVVNVELDTRDTILRVAIRDDGVGGADLRRGSGLVGLRDRVEALGGTLHLTSPVNGGTTLLIEVPLEPHDGAALT
jgi:PAS domain S-box-containing protein